ncbi:hypothetical protein [Pyrococcus kukulkanii]|uniref:AbrB family transcriptional regulator n=1 Tax=Pyrococcus kukulkanii TaxID=1609559 RepID=A0ABV4T916_9EURY
MEANIEREPVVKFHAEVGNDYKITIPHFERKVLSISTNDILGVILRRVEIDSAKNVVNVLKSVYTVVRVGARGKIFLSPKIRKVLGVSRGDLVEVLIVSIRRVRVSSSGDEKLPIMVIIKEPIIEELTNFDKEAETVFKKGVTYVHIEEEGKEPEEATPH